MPFISIQYYQSPFGELIVGAYQNKLCLCDWRYRKMRESVDRRICQTLNAQYREESSPIIEATIEQLQAYAAGKLTNFSLPILPVGTNFQKKVWQALHDIPFGTTISYLQLAEQLGNKNLVRAVASANGANAISIIIPCHRIIGSNGQLTGYAGGLNVKKQLLKIEKPAPPIQQLSLFSKNH
ncbi:methylated-DNA--[protein]-cysteine S-methyltransferase [Carboxylicivirga taeanensis]|uniref:methylated-DNA--[protein]-cysteine S-methyltransferase n=1 Tax=Carboxylicivirga taeanensis TaxID=1416875 RepID=UPI003F6DBAF2